MKIILRIVKIILLIVGLETGYAERSRIFVQASAIFVQASAESNLFGLCRAQPKMSINRACSYCRAQPKISKKRSRKVRVYEPMSGQEKPVISDGFEVQTIHAQPVWLQTVMRISAGLKGFTGKLMRNARARKHISAFSESRPNAHIHAPFLYIFFEIFGCEKSCASRANKMNNCRTHCIFPNHTTKERMESELWMQSTLRTSARTTMRHTINS